MKMTLHLFLGKEQVKTLLFCIQQVKNKNKKKHDKRKITVGIAANQDIPHSSLPQATTR